ncbi:uncharacterized protein LOC135192804 [Pogoniulus pusillus]|uniref:uncharacterized protein LOC135192804 n=1 Tax=Pogoniulus pusillus TaxID=488313 RepID=UPI0030B964EF
MRRLATAQRSRSRRGSVTQAPIQRGPWPSCSPSLVTERRRRMAWSQQQMSLCWLEVTHWMAMMMPGTLLTLGRSLCLDREPGKCPRNQRKDQDPEMNLEMAQSWLEVTQWMAMMMPGRCLALHRILCLDRETGKFPGSQRKEQDPEIWLEGQTCAHRAVLRALELGQMPGPGPWRAQAMMMLKSCLLHIPLRTHGGDSTAS